MFCEKCQTEFALYMDNPRKVRMGTDYMQYDVSHPGCKVMGYPVKGKQWIGDEKWKGQKMSKELHKKEPAPLRTIDITPKYVMDVCPCPCHQRKKGEKE